MGPYAEDDLLPISALQHLLFCERQCALIHIEGLWAENRLTVEGRHFHDTAHGERAGPRGGGRTQRKRGPEYPPARGSHVRIVRGLLLRSLHLGLIGKADIVEFQETGGSRGYLSRGGSTPLPIEYKRGKPKRNAMDVVQLCAQAMCLEEMLGVPVPGGAIFYGSTRRRLDVSFDAQLRAATQDAAIRLRRLIDSRVTPRASREKKCDRCSLVNLCLPGATGPDRSALRYVARALSAASSGEGGA